MAFEYTVRPVASLEELAEAFDVLGAQFTPPFTSEDRGFDDLVRRFAEDRSLMLVVEDQGRIAGGAFAFRTSPETMTIRVVALEPAARGRGIGRRLIEAIEWEAMRLGVHGVALGVAGSEVKGFYARLGYHGRGSMMQKGLPLPGRAREALLSAAARSTRRPAAER